MLTTESNFDVDFGGYSACTWLINLMPCTLMNDLQFNLFDFRCSCYLIRTNFYVIKLAEDETLIGISNSYWWLCPTYKICAFFIILGDVTAVNGVFLICLVLLCSFISYDIESDYLSFSCLLSFAALASLRISLLIFKSSDATDFLRV